MGSRVRIADETAKGEWLRDNFPRLSECDCNWTSRPTWDYNCVGFAVGDYRWWHPDDEYDHHYWPDDATRSPWASAYVEALKTVHFEECDNAEPESGYEKIVVFHKGGLFKHVCIVESAARWRSKLGEYEDLEHPSCGMDDGKYGKVFQYLKRLTAYARQPLPDRYRL